MSFFCNIADKSPHFKLRICIACVAIVFACSMAVADPDLWGHTLYGLRAAELGVLAEPVDPFSYTAAGARWVNHEWLTEYQFGWLWRTCGGFGLWMWRNVLAVVVFGVALAAIQKSRVGLGTTLLLFAFGAESLSTFFIFIRPQLATLALFALFLWILSQHWNEPSRKSIWLLPPLMALWVNLHGGFLAGLVIQGVFAGVAVVRAVVRVRSKAPIFGEQKPKLVHAAVTSISCWLLAALATLINPYGWEMHAMLWQHLVPEQAVAEWQPLWGTKQAVVYYLPLVLLGIAAVGWRRWRLVDVLVMAFVTYAALRHIRHGALLMIAVMVLLPEPLDAGLARLFPNLGERFARWFVGARRTWGVAAAMMLLFATQLPGYVEFWQHRLAPWSIAVETKRSPPGVPARAIALIRDENLHGNLITDYAWGQYVLWHLYPQTKVAFDGRYRTIYSEQLEREFLSFLATNQDGPRTLPLLDNYPTELVLLPGNTPVCDYLSHRPDWVCVLKDQQAALFVKDLPKFRGAIERLTAVGASVPEPRRWLVFPGLETSSAATFVANPAVNKLPRRPLACEVQFTAQKSVAR